LSVKRSFLNVVFLTPLLASIVSGSWNVELLDSKTDERLNTTIVHSSGTVVAIGEENTIVYSEDSGKTWDESEIPDVSRFMESDDLQFLSIVEIPGTKQLLTLGAVYEESPSVPVGPSLPGIGGVSVQFHSKPSIEKWTAVLISSDGGRRWKLLKRIEDVALYWAFTFSDNSCIMIGFSDSLYQYADEEITSFGPTTFTDSEKKLFSFSFFKMNDFSNITDITFRQYRDYLFIVSENKYLAMSKDYGATWNQLESNLKDYDMNTIDILDKKTILAGCDDGHLLVSFNAGLTWTASKISDQSINDISVSINCDWWVVGDDGYIAYSSNSGESWNKILTSTDENLRNITVSKGCTEAWACGDDGTLVHLYKNRHAEPITSKNKVVSRDENEDVEEYDEKENEISWETRSLKHAHSLYKPIGINDTLYQGIDLNISPEGSTIIIDEQTYTGTHLKIPLPPGNHFYSVAKTGHFTVQESFDISIGEIKEEDVKLKKFKILISPSGGLSFLPNNSGMNSALNFSLTCGVLTNNHLYSSIEFNGNALLTNDSRLGSITFCSGYSSDPEKKIILLPILAIGGTKWVETKDSLKSFTTSKPYNSVYTDSVEYTVSSLHFTLEASLDIIAHKSNRWGFLWRPSFFWVNQKGYHFVIRFGGILWI
jgi:photosystem II stability/assembly factor-like uncharacterized protein